MDFSEQIKIKRCHPVIVSNAGEEVHEDQLAVALATISRFLFSPGFLLRTTFDNDDRWGPATGNSYGKSDLSDQPTSGKGKRCLL